VPTTEDPIEKTHQSLLVEPGSLRTSHISRARAANTNRPQPSKNTITTTTRIVSRLILRFSKSKSDRPELHQSVHKRTPVLPLPKRSAYRCSILTSPDWDWNETMLFGLPPSQTTAGHRRSRQMSISANS
jgi:hypothetical protein